MNSKRMVKIKVAKELAKENLSNIKSLEKALRFMPGVERFYQEIGNRVSSDLTAKIFVDLVNDLIVEIKGATFQRVNSPDETYARLDGYQLEEAYIFASYVAILIGGNDFSQKVSSLTDKKIFQNLISSVKRAK